MIFEKENPVYLALGLLIERAKEIQNYMASSYRTENYKSFLNEFCTIKVCSARRSGHSSAIAKYAVEEMAKGKDVIILSWTMRQSDLYTNMIRQFVKEEDIELVKFTKYEFRTKSGSIILSSKGHGDFDRLRGLSCDYLLVDVACMWSKKDIKELYKVGGECLRYRKNPIIAFLE